MSRPPPHIAAFPGWGTPGSLQHTAHIAAPLCSGGLAFSSVWQWEKTKWHLSKDDLNYSISFFYKATAPAVLLYSLCWKSPALLQLRHLCWNLGNDRLVTENCLLRAQDYANSSVTIIQFYSTAAQISVVPDTTKSHYGQGDSPGYIQPSTTG